jgi:hypothetical protein
MEDQPFFLHLRFRFFGFTVELKRAVLPALAAGIIAAGAVLFLAGLLAALAVGVPVAILAALIFGKRVEGEGS